jgi:hypothetical protein
MSNLRLRLTFAGETMSPHVSLRPEFAPANSGLATELGGGPLLLTVWGTFRFPTPLPAHRPKVAR